MHLLDTNILSELRRPLPEPRVLFFVESHRLEDLFISVVSIAEIRFGIESASNPQVRADLEKWLLLKVRPSFLGRTLDVTETVLLRWRTLLDAGRKAGRPYSAPDLLLAATAQIHGLAVVTRNVKDFQGLGLNLINPWDIP